MGWKIQILQAFRDSELYMSERAVTNTYLKFTLCPFSLILI